MLSSCWRYVNTILDPADVGIRAQSSKQPSSLELWLKRTLLSFAGAGGCQAS